MYSTCLFGGLLSEDKVKGNGRAGFLLASSLIVLGLFSVEQAAAANLAAADTAATMRYGSGSTSFPAAGVNFDLLAVDSGLDADCDPAISSSQDSAGGGRADSGDTILLAKLDSDDKKPLRPIRSKPAVSKASNAANTSTATTAAVNAPPAVDARPLDPTWEIIVSDKTLNAAMARWAAQAGWQLLWELPVDYAVEAHTTVHGTFEEAVTTVAKSMESAEIPMKAVFYKGNKVLRIMAKGSE